MIRRAQDRLCYNKSLDAENRVAHIGLRSVGVYCIAPSMSTQGQ